MIKINTKILNSLNIYAKTILNDESVNIHVDYDGFNALVFETDSNTIYFTFNVDFENHTFIMGTHYFNEHLELVFKETQKYNSLILAIHEIVFIIQTLTNITTE